MAHQNDSKMTPEQHLQMQALTSSLKWHQDCLSRPSVKGTLRAIHEDGLEDVKSKIRDLRDKCGLPKIY